ncbi:hypothetical protein BD780_001603 [Clostridium tetanomorphum]|uniref:Uncharacterized protein n=1 Tax=Clostridium tetanomorphum TaxID=1553 RepID=A0A923EAA5_CLOTT|nr:hypothetical protein [Clostridium tetanomorphum]KAJ52677.1 hypothetical protein CTM_06816 [Clostridium tetanomorphum DSM 665]MBC2396770.1 hypothetical protein [Clostridium tetanomorphum]MBP1863270.1 hypothetical protein [Clostridium tetanomorphum]NRS84378.1 hypothetical protein [Clostridium tetanomorphum]NRZ97593.1 hypothetical protein [Clostridium tetanomorphum]
MDAANAKWDICNKIIDKYLKYILDVKPITAIKFIKSRYRNIEDSMQPLVYKDIRSDLQKIK